MKKRIAILKKEGITVRTDYDFVDDKTFEQSLETVARQFQIDMESIITYTLGDQDEMEEGTCYFCPRCGAYNEYGFSPEVHLYFRKNKDNKLQEEGYHKSLDLSCMNCDGTFFIHTDQFEEESKKLTDALQEKLR